MQPLIALLAGLLFGLGLTISGIIDPAKVLGFLDVAGNWDPSLAFVRAGAIPVAAIGFALSRRRAAPYAAGKFVAPTKTAIDIRLLVGAVTFGTGWGLAGYCPGPAIASLSIGSWRTATFVAAMLMGMTLFRLIDAGEDSRKEVAPGFRTG
ncbi:MAG: membrane protein [Bradyrhizobium sp.]